MHRETENQNRADIVDGSKAVAKIFVGQICERPAICFAAFFEFIGRNQQRRHNTGCHQENAHYDRRGSE